MTHAVPAPRPKESEFYLPMVYLLGKLTGFKPYVGVPHEKIQDDVLRLAGFEIELDDDGQPVRAADAAGNSWRLHSTDSKTRDGLYRVVHFAWYHQTRQYRPESKALCAKPWSSKRGQWALTELGVRKARELRAEYEGKIVLSAGPNVTAQFIGDNFDRLYDRVTGHLRRKMPRSEIFDKIDDHAMNWFDRIIQRDGLRTRIENKRSIPPSQVCAWARRGAYTDIRNEGREPVCRVFHGALTRPEIAQYDPSNWTTEVVPRTINESERLAINTYSEHSEDDYVGDTIDNLADDHVSARVEDAILDGDAFEHVLERVAQILHDELDASQDPAFHEQIVHDRFIKEMTLQEIAAAHGLGDDEDQVNVALNRVRAAMLRAKDDGIFDEFLSR